MLYEVITVTSQGKRIKLLGSRGFAWEDFDYTAKLIINHVINPLPLVTKILKFNADILKHLQHEGALEHNIKILMTPRITSYNVCYTKLLRRLH